MVYFSIIEQNFKNMASPSKKNLVRLVSTAGSGTFFVRKANNKDKGKLSMRKYDKKLRKHVIFSEKKMK
jgi:large subunit ribosomal protein L33